MDDRVLSRSLRKQMVQNEFNEAFLRVTKNMSRGLIVLLVIVTWAEGHEYILFIRAMSIILHFPLVQIALPVNMLSQIAILLKVVMFDVLEFTNIWEHQSIIKFADDIELGLID